MAIRSAASTPTNGRNCFLVELGLRGAPSQHGGWGKLVDVGGGQGLHHLGLRHASRHGAVLLLITSDCASNMTLFVLSTLILDSALQHGPVTAARCAPPVAVRCSAPPVAVLADSRYRKSRGLYETLEQGREGRAAPLAPHGESTAAHQV